MGKKRKLTPAEKAAKQKRRLEYETVFMNGRMKRVRKPPMVEGMALDEFLRTHADPIFLHQEGLWEYIELRDAEDQLQSSPRSPGVPGPFDTPLVVPEYTRKQGQYLAFIHHYAKLHGRPPAEADMQRYFGVTPPTVHQMVVKLEQRGFIERTPGKARSIRVLVPVAELPRLE
jgi:repressor LexA